MKTLLAVVMVVSMLNGSPVLAQLNDVVFSSQPQFASCILDAAAFEKLGLITHAK